MPDVPPLPMKTTHTLHTGDARQMDAVPDASVALVVTSPPYPMIEMWDAVFEEINPAVETALTTGDGWTAFEAMHVVLDTVWAECARVLLPGSFLCINVGDATRTINGHFALYPNHSRIVQAALRLGLTPLPDVLWRKPTNAPNKFMGSGMLPAGAYVTYEHEYILVFRKGGKRTFARAEDKLQRAQSAYFWEERNRWFSDIWADVRGAGQWLAAPDLRARSAAFPLEIPYRLVQMYSVYGDTVLDPFVGTGTTMSAAMASGRSSIGYDCDAGFASVVQTTLKAAVLAGQVRCRTRLVEHQMFVAGRLREGKTIKHVSEHYGFPVMTQQERQIELWEPVRLHTSTAEFTCEHRRCEMQRVSAEGDGMAGDLFADLEASQR